MEEAEIEVILQLSKIYSSNTNKLSADSIVSKQVINTRDLVMHGTNGFAFLLSCLSGTKILPAYEREKIGIPTVTGEATHYANDMYHDWQHFVSSISLDRLSNPTGGIALKYA